MGSITTLEEAKAHLRVDHNDEDFLINGYLQAATAAAYDYLNWTEAPAVIPSPVISAVLLAVGDLYENRERHIESRMVESKTYQLLLNPYRNMSL